jgi:hypothetical protein
MIGKVQVGLSYERVRFKTEFIKQRTIAKPSFPPKLGRLERTFTFEWVEKLATHVRYFNHRSLLLTH